jgi:hypothetical protein
LENRVSKTFLRIYLTLTAIVLPACSQFALAQDHSTTVDTSYLRKDVVIYPGQGTTINGKPVYVSALLSAGDRVQTTTTSSKITVGSVEVDISPDTTVTIREPLILNCGTVFVRSGSIAISADTFTAGRSAEASASCKDTLPDSPGAVRSEQDLRSTSAARRRRTSGAPATAGGIGLHLDSQVRDWSYLTVNGAMLTSSIISAKLTQDCLHSGKCDFVPDAFRSWAAMYGAGVPAAVGVAYLGYYLKKKGYRWWFVPAALVTAGNTVVSAHAAHYSQ